MKELLMVTVVAVLTMAGSAHANEITTKYPWMIKSQTELTKAECTAAMQHDSNYWWAHGKCHMKFIRYAVGVVIKDVVAKENPDTIMKKGELFHVTQYRPDEGTYCGHGDYCYPAKNIKLLGSVLTGPYSTEKTGDETDLWQGVGAYCELILADRINIIEANAQEMFTDCH
jgi:hypothetical protein